MMAMKLHDLVDEISLQDVDNAGEVRKLKSAMSAKMARTLATLKEYYTKEQKQIAVDNSFSHPSLGTACPKYLNDLVYFRWYSNMYITSF